MAGISFYAGLGLAPDKKQFAFALNFSALKQVIGERLKQALSDHFMKLNSERSSGITKRGFYEQAARSLSIEYPEDGVEVITERRGILLRYFGSGGLPGGVVRPVRAKYLTIPAIAEAYGRPARSFSGLIFVRFGKGEDAPAALMEAGKKSARVAKTGKKVRNVFKVSGTQGAFPRRVFYWLVKETKHHPDETVLPPQSELEEIVVKEAENFIALNYTGAALT